jgi:hypothetical protein
MQTKHRNGRASAKIPLRTRSRICVVSILWGCEHVGRVFLEGSPLPI